MDPEKSSIERLKETLYSRNEDIVPKEKRTPVSAEPIPTEVPKDWGTKRSFDVPMNAPSDSGNRFFKRFLYGSLIFLGLAVIISVFIFFGGLNMISSNNVDIRITAPTSVSSGEEADMGLSIVNQNSADLLGVTLYIDYPEGVRAAATKEKTLSHDKVDLGDIPTGGAKDYNLRVLLFGQADSTKTFTFRLEYAVKGSNATFSKEKKYDVTISSSPLTLLVSAPSEINSGQEIDISVTLSSASPAPVQNSLVKVVYPYGFTYKDANIKALRDGIWALGDLKNGDKKNLVIHGTLVGQDMEDRTFQITAGVESPDRPGNFQTALAAAQATVGIRKSFFDLGVSAENKGIVEIGRSVPVTIQFQNTLPDKVMNARIEAVLSGNVLNTSSVSANDGGFYRSSDNTVIWDKNSTSVLSTISPGDAGNLSFSLSSLSDPVAVRSIKNPHIDIRVNMSGDRVGMETERISSTANITLKIPSTLSLSSKVHRTVGPFTNIGPIPPKVDKESTYTVTWTLTNTTNDLTNGIVTATLPTGILWKEESSPAGERITYNADTRTVTWNVGNISALAGFTYSPKEVNFKVALIPNLSQAGSAPELVAEAAASATDSYANTTVRAMGQILTTQFSDPSYKVGNNIVIK